MSAGDQLSFFPEAASVDLPETIEFAEDWIRSRHGSPAEFIKAMDATFGSMVRMHLLEILREVRAKVVTHAVWGKYLEHTLHEEAIREALGEEPRSHEAEIATIDELFRRSKKLATRKGFSEAMNFVSRLRKYSAFNNMLVFVQNPYTRFYATAAHWRKEFRRTIKEDARPMVILAPMTPVLLVYDVEDTYGPPLPEWFTRVFEAEGDFSEAVFRRTLENCERDAILAEGAKLGLTVAGVAMRALDPSVAKCRVKLNQNHDFKKQYATLCHELAHIHLGHCGSDDDKWWPSRLGLTRAQRELEAEAVAYIVCSRAGLVTRSDEYLAGYVQNDEDLAHISLDLIVKVAGYIERMGHEKLPKRKKRGQETSTR